MGGAGREADADAKLMVEWGADFDAFDPVTQVCVLLLGIFVSLESVLLLAQ